ncbi:MAG: DinB family protein, partial [Flavobacteriales bacterium]|nr:DinB family protein [Flavobacteriales bacterium]
MESHAPTIKIQLSRKERLTVRYRKVRQRSESLCQPLSEEDYVVQPIVDVSPPKWHLGHTSWFFETFVLSTDHSYSVFHPE